MADFEDSPILGKLLEDFTKRVERSLQDAVRREGIVLTRELLNSIRAGAVNRGKGWISAHVYYSDLLRIKDMKVLNYSTIPPIGPLVRWIERVGVGRFAYVPGYPRGVKPATEIEAIYRIASGIQYNLRATPNVQRGYRGIYNDNLKYNLIPQFYDDMRQAAAVWAAEQIRESFGLDVPVRLPGEELNASRIQAAWNARDTKLARKYANQ